MKIERNQNNNELVLKIIGRLDTLTAPELDKEIKDMENVTRIVMDFSELQYVSSAGLRVLLATKKMMNKISGEMILKNVNEDVMEVFDITGFTDILTFE